MPFFYILTGPTFISLFSLLFYLFWLSSIVNYLNYYWMTIKVIYSVLSSWTIFVIWVINSDEQRQVLFWLCLYWQWLQVSLQRHDIGAQCGTTATNITAKTIIDFNAKVNQQKQQKSQKSLRQLVVVPSTADAFPDDLDGYDEPDPYKNHPAAFVPSKVQARRIPPYLNIFIHEHHITPTCKRWTWCPNSILFCARIWMKMRNTLTLTFE